MGTAVSPEKMDATPTFPPPSSKSKWADECDPENWTGDDWDASSDHYHVKKMNSAANINSTNNSAAHNTANSSGTSRYDGNENSTHSHVQNDWNTSSSNSGSAMTKGGALHSGGNSTSTRARGDYNEPPPPWVNNSSSQRLSYYGGKQHWNSSNGTNYVFNNGRDVCQNSSILVFKEINS